MSVQNVLVISFGPFAGRTVNGSTTVAKVLARRHPSIDHRVLPVTWDAIQRTASNTMDGYDFAVGLGEGFPHVVAVEQMAFNWPRGEDEEGKPAPTTLREGAPPFLEAAPTMLRWDHRVHHVPDELRERMGYEQGHPCIIGGTFAGYGQCNALFFHLLSATSQAGHGKRCGFVHLPPQEGWQRRTKRDADEYEATFADAVSLILSANEWIKEKHLVG